jgi:hypothetical protein
MIELGLNWLRIVFNGCVNIENNIGKVKVKVKLYMCLTKHHTMKTYWWSGGIAPRILDLGTRWR